MPAPLRLTAAAAAAIANHAQAEYPRECCGLVAGDQGRVAKLYEITNIYQGNDFFEMESVEQKTALGEIWDEKGWQLLAIYHSHPDSEAYPSARDKAIALWPGTTEAVYPGTYYVICSLADRLSPVLRAFLYEQGEVVEAPVEIGG